MASGLSAWLPIGAVVAWWGLAVYLVSRDRYRTWSEIFFLGSATATGAYAFSDLLVFTATTPAVARMASIASFSAFTLTAGFFALHGLVLATRMHRAWFLLFAGIGGLLVLVPLRVVTGVQEVQDLATSYLPALDVTAFGVWVAAIAALGVAGLAAHVKVYVEVRAAGPRLRGRMGLVVAAFAVAVVLGASTNTLAGLLSLRIVPLFSTLLAVPGAFVLYANTPLVQESFSAALDAWKSRRHHVEAALLTFRDGTMVAALRRPGTQMVDEDLIGGTLDTIQNYLRFTFPSRAGGGLRAIAHGDHLLLIEKGRWTSLTLLLKGEESDPLRRRMRDAVREFEERNRQAFEHWRGLPEDAEGAEDVLRRFLPVGT